MNSALKLLFVGLLLDLIYLNGVAGLKCYTCSDCEKGDISKKDCGSAGDTCLKFDMGDTVMKSCIRKELCNLKGVESQLTDWWKALTNSKAKKSESAINCCHSDYCNSGTTASTTLGLFVVGALVTFFYG